jgi:hypothetical protein
LNFPLKDMLQPAHFREAARMVEGHYTEKQTVEIFKENL